MNSFLIALRYKLIFRLLPTEEIFMDWGCYAAPIGLCRRCLVRLNNLFLLIFVLSSDSERNHHADDDKLLHSLSSDNGPFRLATSHLVIMLEHKVKIVRSDYGTQSTSTRPEKPLPVVSSSTS